MPEDLQRKVYDFAVRLKTRVAEEPFNGAALSESALARDWIARRGRRVGKPVAGEIVVIPFPQTDLAVGKRRPAFVLVDLPGDDVILCQITTRARADGFSIPLDTADFERGHLVHPSFIRPTACLPSDTGHPLIP